MNESNVLSLVSLLEDKKICLIEIFKITRSQSTAIKEEEIEKIEILLDKKSSMIEEINVLDSKIKDIIGDNKIEDKTLLSSVAEIKEILKEIKQIDDKNNENLSTAVSEMKLNLKEVRCGQRAMKNYGNSDPYQSFASLGGTLFIDQDS